MSAPLPLAFTCGDPAGVGPEIIARWLTEHPAEAAGVAVLGPSRWLATLTYSPAAIENAPASRPAMPAKSTTPLSVPVPAKPSRSVGRLPVFTDVSNVIVVSGPSQKMRPSAPDAVMPPEPSEPVLPSQSFTMPTSDATRVPPP